MSSNVINLIQYLATIILNKNTNKLKNIAIKADIILVLMTIIIPIMLLKLNIKIDIFVVPLFIILYMLFLFLNYRVHKLYLDVLDEEQTVQEDKKEKINNKKTLKYIVVLVTTGVLLFIISEVLGDTLENLCNLFNVPQFIIGMLLGIITSIPELITFFESQKYHKKVKDDMLGVVEATNNLLTSNTLNLFIIQTIGILIISI